MYVIIILVFSLSIASCEDSTCDRNGDGTVDMVEKKICGEDLEKPARQEQQPREENKINLPIQEEGEYTINTAFISIHLEPGSAPKTTDYPAQYWSDLVNLVALARSSAEPVCIDARVPSMTHCSVSLFLYRINICLSPFQRVFKPALLNP